MATEITESLTAARQPAHAAARCAGDRPGTPCQRKPPGDHLARYLDAYTAGQLSREYLAAVLGELVVIARWRIVRDGTR